MIVHALLSRWCKSKSKIYGEVAEMNTYYLVVENAGINIGHALEQGFERE